MPLQRNQSIPLSIDSISSDGSGVGRHDGLVVFVPGTAVGDVIRAKIVKPAKNHAFAIVEEVETPGPGRITPDCPISGKCGGCTFRHLSYEAELAAKQSFVEDALSRIGKISAEVLPVLPSPQENRYRNKVQFPVAPDVAPDGTRKVLHGFYASRSHRIIPCADCLLQPELLNQIAARAAALVEDLGIPAYDEATGEGIVRHIYLRQGAGGTGSGEVLLCLVCTKAAFAGLDELKTTLLSDFPQITSIIVNVNRKNTNVILGDKTAILHGPGYIRHTLAGVPMRLDAHTFAQVNTAAAERLFAAAREFAAPTPGGTLVDLYCGTGVIGLSMARPAGRLIGVDIVPQSIQQAQASATEMGLEASTRFLCMDAAEAAAQLLAEGTRPEVAVLDPPRKGAGAAALAPLMQMAPKRVVMVSCNPATLARDLAILEENGYTTRKAQPVDLFPRTKHVETVVLLEKC